MHTSHPHAPGVPRVLRVPGDKSISHRALILSALAEGTSLVHGLLDSADVRATAAALRALGAAVEPAGDAVRVRGVGLRGLRTPAAPLDCANSGTTTRLLAGVVAGAVGVEATFTGDASLSRRPMRRVAEPLRRMGAEVELAAGDTLPMRVRGAALAPTSYATPTASAQVKSAVLLAALVAGVEAEVREPVASRGHTEAMLAARGVPLELGDRVVRLRPVERLAARDVAVPGDPSSAAFFAALAAAGGAGPDGLALDDVCVAAGRTGFLDLLREMGAAVALEPRAGWEEPVARVHVAPGALRAIRVGAAQVPAAVDELPMLGCLATRATGETVVTGAEELRVKESDRIAALVANLRAVGADAEELPDGFVVRGTPDRALSGEIRTHGDHRLAMAFGILGAFAGNEVRVDDPHCVDVSYPAFWAHLRAVGGR